MQITIAGAGAGKTTAMADIIAKLYEKTDRRKYIFCITFTNNAVSCIEKKLLEHYGIIPSNIIVSTIHSFLYREFIKPYYYLLFGKQYEQISIAELPAKPEYKNAKIKRLEDSNILHQTVIPERAKWIVVRKSDDRKAVNDKRKVILDIFKEYCGGICIDEAQDIDSDMQLIIETLDELDIPIKLMGDPKQDLKGYKCLNNLIEKYKESVEYKGICHRCPQIHLLLSNTIVSSREQQYSNKQDGSVTILFESDKEYRMLKSEEDFDLCYISKKQSIYVTHNEEPSKNIIISLAEEIESEIRRLYSNKSELTLLRISYYYAELLLNNYAITNDKKKAISKTFNYILAKDAYCNIINMLSDNLANQGEKKEVVNAIDNIKGQEGSNCLFILTTDLAAYLFGEKKKDNKTKNKLYVALTRSLNKLTIYVTKEVENKYIRENIISYFEKILFNKE